MRPPAAPGVLIARVLEHGLPRRRVGIDESLVGDVQVGEEDLGRREVRVHGQGPLRLDPSGRQAVRLQVRLAERHQDLGRQRVDLLGSCQLLRGGAFVIAGEEELPFEPGGTPAVGVDADRRLVDLIDDVVEGVAELCAPRIGAIVPLRGLADQEQGIGILHDIRTSVVVAVNEPLAGDDGLLDLAAKLQQPGLDPACEQVVGVDLLSPSHRGLGGLPFAASQYRSESLPGRSASLGSSASAALSRTIAMS